MNHGVFLSGSVLPRQRTASGATATPESRLTMTLVSDEASRVQNSAPPLRQALQLRDWTNATEPISDLKTEPANAGTRVASIL